MALIRKLAVLHDLIGQLAREVVNGDLEAGGFEAVFEVPPAVARVVDLAEDARAVGGLDR